MSKPSPLPTRNTEHLASASSSSGLRKLVLFSGSLLAAGLLLFSPLNQNAVSKALRPSQPTVSQVMRRTGIARTQNSGYWHTQGARVLTVQNVPVRISGMNWSGFETTAMVPGGLKLQDYHSILRSIAASGFNTVRIPFSNQMIESPTVPSDLRFENEHGSINTDLANLDSLQILDRIVDAAGELGLKVILDNHRSEAGSSAEANGLWYAEGYPEQAWIADWVSLANRYRGNSTVIGFDLRNEPHNAAQGGACWDCGGPRDWHLAASRAGNAVLRVNPSLLIFVEGTDQYGSEGDFWGGNLAGVRTSPVRLALPGHVVYSPHVYGPTEYNQAWFNASTTPASLASLWRRHWAYLSESGVAPVWIGEFGTPNSDGDVVNTEPGSEGQWFQALISFLSTHSNIGWSYWGVNGEDRYGLLDSSYGPLPANHLKAAALASIRLPEMPGVAPQAEQNVESEDAVTVPARVQPVTAVYTDQSSVQPAAASYVVTRPVTQTAVLRTTANPAAVGLSDNGSQVESSVAEQVRQATAQALQNLPSRVQ